MTEPMTASEARELIDVLNDYGKADEEGVICTVSRQALHEAMECLREYAAMKERQTVDREAVRECVWNAVRLQVLDPENGPNIDAWTDRILALIPAGRVSVKALEWERTDPVAHIAKTGLGKYKIICADEGRIEWQAPCDFPYGTGVCNTLEAAKAAAQAHYEAAILSAVDAGPDVSGLVEALELAAPILAEMADDRGEYLGAHIQEGGSGTPSDSDLQIWKAAEAVRQALATFKGET